MLRALALGQGLSVLIAGTGIFSSALVAQAPARPPGCRFAESSAPASARLWGAQLSLKAGARRPQGVSLPASQSLLNYVCLGAVYGGLLLRRRRRLRAAWWQYAALAAVDVLANFCLVQAYRYTTLTSVTLLDCFTVPCVLLLSWLCLGAHYKLQHWAGALVCLVGLALLVLTDRAFSDNADAPRPLLGDGLVILGAALYAVCNVAQEKLLGDTGQVEVLGMLGCFGSLWGGALAAGLEGRALAAVTWSPKVVGPFLGFNAAMFAFSSLVPHVLLWGGAAALNLSLLTSDLWAAAARVAFFGGFTAASAVAFACAFALVVAGLLLYSLAGDVYQHKAEQTYAGVAGETAEAEEAGEQPKLQPTFDTEGQALLPASAGVAVPTRLREHRLEGEVQRLSVESEP